MIKVISMDAILKTGFEKINHTINFFNNVITKQYFFNTTIIKLSCTLSQLFSYAELILFIKLISITTFISAALFELRFEFLLFFELEPINDVFCSLRLMKR